MAWNYGFSGHEKLVPGYCPRTAQEGFGPARKCFKIDYAFGIQRYFFKNSKTSRRPWFKAVLLGLLTMVWELLFMVLKTMVLSRLRPAARP
jgi:hypothetical protein